LVVARRSPRRALDDRPSPYYARTRRKTSPNESRTNQTPQVGQAFSLRLAAKGGKARKIFRSADKDGSGDIGPVEFRQLLTNMNIVMTDADFETFWKVPFV
jgi:hypothetical protein